MTKQIKLLSIAGLVIVLFTGFGIFTLTQMNEATEDTSAQPESSQVEEVEESTTEDKISAQENINESVETVEEADSQIEKNSSVESVDKPSSKDYETYTNEYFPDFSFDYPNSWNVEVTTGTELNKPTYNVRVQTREADRLDFMFTPTVARGCDNQPNRVLNRNIAPDLYEFKDSNSFTYYYSKNKNLNNCVVESNISSTISGIPGAVITDNQGNSLYTLSISGQFTPDLALEVGAILKSAIK